MTGNCDDIDNHFIAINKYFLFEGNVHKKGGIQIYNYIINDK